MYADTTTEQGRIQRMKQLYRTNPFKGMDIAFEVGDMDTTFYFADLAIKQKGYRATLAHAHRIGLDVDYISGYDDGEAPRGSH